MRGGRDRRGAQKEPFLSAKARSVPEGAQQMAGRGRRFLAARRAGRQDSGARRTCVPLRALARTYRTPELSTPVPGASPSPAPAAGATHRPLHQAAGIPRPKPGRPGEKWFGQTTLIWSLLPMQNEGVGLGPKRARVNFHSINI